MTAALIGAGALILAVAGGYWFTVGVLALASRGARRSGEGQGPSSKQAKDALRGGRWIGYLERAGVAAAILTGQPSAVAIVVAVKGLGRFAELKGNPDASERFVIGTLASLLFAAACGGLGAWLI
ncbi:hypothetical protein GCM10010401_22450 [Rarobacter faecitabidus]|uniref:Uncharacterized protein n=1 Tax=Rarobacter faecitabidus TaxID=13243 RepID=A0A542ZVQ2_RARFA|nr:hypothetical protein [Rarobacter faecitabidus]TQL64447.1 hypothetical protein FB461_0951 [Rarobacter faecitabidus]